MFSKASNSTSHHVSVSRCWPASHTAYSQTKEDEPQIRAVPLQSQQHMSAGRSTLTRACGCRMMQATMQTQYEPSTIMAPPQQLAFGNASSMQRANPRQGHYQPLALMGPQHQLGPGRQHPLQLPYTSHLNPVAQQDNYQDDQVTCSTFADMPLLLTHQFCVYR